MTEEIGFEIHLELPYDEALEKVTDALKEQGFGVLTKIDVKATLKEKLDEDFRPYAILGACNPPLAHKALSSDATIGLMLPCNCTVEAKDETNSIVRILNPKVMMGFGNLDQNETLIFVADEASERLTKVAETLRA
ncbi:MAG: DUF302 domain-containing protein [Anaerolineales bacterium]|nr:DUF302 domain-containing protein [Chloroflexota bacterium]MBL6983857.1 DUF302 domain-containing protein [Anaerolineales bacterium]